MDLEIMFDAPETFAYAHYDISCPMCDGHFLSTIEEPQSIYYVCGTCGCDWTTLEG